jgi:hypothetical protein
MGRDRLYRSVIAGLDPAIHHSEKMDARVKPAHDMLKFYNRHCGESF